jgi:hypothetical protein
MNIPYCRSILAAAQRVTVVHQMVCVVRRRCLLWQRYPIADAFCLVMMLAQLHDDAGCSLLVVLHCVVERHQSRSLRTGIGARQFVFFAGFWFIHIT